ncbi:hypothetical protein ABEG17_15720 [Pedococcus sp. KACC 23699]|uniref:Uncharacterized protein n=1 Tax=Pedococcus sp. KACC 23699 TaxID=3149228 RepID=A0AAU7JRT5_9MICO
MADQHDQPAPVGSVAQEAARLLDALGGWASTSGYGAGRGEDRPRQAAPGGDDPEGAGPEGADPEGAGPEASVPPDETTSHAAGHCDQCGAANAAGQAVVCQWCPVCQGIGVLRSVRPETVDRLADLAGALAATLREAAAHARSTAGNPPGTQAQNDARARGPRVQDITIEDEDQGSATR